MSTTSVEAHIAYLTIMEEPKDTFSEALILVDGNGYPIDYRYTDKISVTEIQRAIYGAKLKEYLSTEIFGTKLLNDLEHQPTIVLVNEEYMLKLRDKIDYPIIFVQNENSNMSNSQLKKITHPENEKDLEKSEALLIKCEKKFDILEPFNRINQAIKSFENEK